MYPPKDDISLNPSGPCKTQSPNLGHHWPSLVKLSGLLTGEGMAADPRHPQVPCSGGQAPAPCKREHGHRGVYVRRVPIWTNALVVVAPRYQDLEHLLISFLPVAAAPRCPVPKIPNALQANSFKAGGLQTPL